MATLTKAQQTAADQAEALEDLRYALIDGIRVYTILRHVSASGMERAISVVVVNEDGSAIHDISYMIVAAGLYKNHPKHLGLKVRGTGMDMGYAVVNHLSHAVFGDGDVLSQEWL